MADHYKHPCIGKHGLYFQVCPLVHPFCISDATIRNYLFHNNHNIEIIPLILDSHHLLITLNVLILTIYLAAAFIQG